MTHTALSGTGLGDLGDLLATPICGDAQVQVWPLHHGEECAQPGYYGLNLSTDCRIEATATQRVGYTRVSCQLSTAPCGLRLDARWGQNSRTSDAKLGARADGSHVVRVTGWRRSEGFGRRQGGMARAVRNVFFACTAEAIDGSRVRFRREADRQSPAVVLIEAEVDLVVACGISATSVKGALENLRAEGLDAFDAVALDAEQEWTRLLFDDFTVRVHVGTVSESVLRSALYHTLIVPNLISDVHGPIHRKFGNRTAPAYYSTLSTWDTFRAAQPWLTLFRPDIALGVSRSMVAWARANSRRLPKWLLWTYETDTMIAYHGVAILTDAILKGLVDDVDAALDAIEGTTDDVAELEPGARLYHAKLRPISSTFHESVSTGLELAVDDACAARAFRARLRDDDDVLPDSTRTRYEVAAQRLERRAQLYRAYFDSTTTYFRGAASDTTQRYGDSKFDPLEFHYANREDAHDFTEGSALQSTRPEPA